MERQSKGSGMFLLGLLTGLIAASAVIGGALVAVQRRGVVATVDTGAMAAEVEVMVRTAVKQEAPAIIAGMGRDLTTRISGESARLLRSTTVDLGGFQATLPSEVTSVLQQRIDQALQGAATRILTEKELDQLAEKMAGRSFVLVRGRLDRYLQGKQVIVRPWSWYSVPVTLQPR